MPLKHATETRLIVLLGGTIVGVGVAMRFLPLPADGVFLFGGLFLLSFLYPLLLFPLFRARRADYTLRILHYLPFLLLLAWVTLHLLRRSGAPASSLFEWYTWEKGLLPILFSFLLLFLYCFRVLRQRVRRSIALSVFLLFFVVSSVYGQLGAWRDFLAFSSEEVPSKDLGSSSVNTGPSSSLGEEVWRMRLRRMHRRQGRLLQDDGLVDRPSLPVEGVPVLMNASSSSTPPMLVSSGMGFEWGVVLLLALYTGILHARARRRA